MPDAVHFLTREDTGTPANSSGCNGFCAPFLYDITGIEEFFPIAMTQQEAKTLQCRVRRLAVVTDLSVTADTVTAEFDSARMGGGSIRADGAEATTEWDLRQQGADGPGIVCSFPLVSTPSGISIVQTLTVFIGGASVFPAIYRDGSDFYPYFALVLDITVTDVSSGSQIRLKIDSSPSAIPSPDGTITGHFMGKDVTLYYKKTVDAGGPNSFVFTQLDIAPDTAANSWWPHASDADGSPIFDDATGAQLQDENN